VPSGKVKWFNAEKGFGFLAREGGPDVYVHKDALPTGTAELKPGQRVEFGIVAGRRGDQALQVQVLDPLPSVVAATRKKPDDLVPIIEDLIKLLDNVSEGLRHGRHPDKPTARQIGAVLRAVATDLEG
jgi:CspA family cold shock protein